MLYTLTKLQLKICCVLSEYEVYSYCAWYDVGMLLC